MIRHILPILIALAAFPVSAAEFEFKDGDRVVWIGSTLIEREQRYGYWEAALTAANPDKNITFRNLGWSGDTVWGEARAGFGTIADGYKQLIDHVKAEKPTVIIVGYGTNESFAGAEGLPKFKEQLKKLLDDLAVTKARLVFLSPVRIQKMRPPLPDVGAANSNRFRYGFSIGEEAERRNAKFIDFFGTDFEKGLPSEDGITLHPLGYLLTTRLFSRELAHQEESSYIVVDAKKNTVSVRNGDARIISSLKFTLMRKQILSGFDSNEALIRNLSQGKYTLLEDGKPIATATSEQWGPVDEFVSGGVYVSKNSAERIQAEKLRQTIIAKNELYFHRWRPQNITYLFGFRKGEQGNNAVEIPQFDPLVAEKEKEIAKLRKPVEHVYELVPVKK